MITIRVRLFAGQRDIVGAAELALPLPADATVASAWAALVERYPRLSGYAGRMLYAVNQEYATLTTALHEHDEVAFIPPVSGGISARGI
jgi:molybdopterin converting factor subunit 1